MTSRALLIEALRSYTSVFPDEMQFRDQFLELLLFRECYFRTHLPGHITGSAWIVNKTYDKVLLVHHATLNKWLQPGGHADGDENVLRVAQREAVEETGLRALKLLKNDLFDIDIHPIPAKTNFPGHHHYDLRFVFEADDADAISVSEESHDVAWVALTGLIRLTNTNPSILRMAEKTRVLF